MPRKKSDKDVPIDQLRWRLDPATLPFESTEDLKPLREIIGQDHVEMLAEKPPRSVFTDDDLKCREIIEWCDLEGNPLKKPKKKGYDLYLGCGGPFFVYGPDWDKMIF